MDSEGRRSLNVAGRIGFRSPARTGAFQVKTEFIKPRLVGKRFEEHSIPVEVLKDWAVFEDLIVETARWLYKVENHDRQRVPRGFSEGFALHLSAVEEGSAVPAIDRVHMHSQLFPDANAVWFDKARDRVLQAIEAVNKGLPIADLLPSFLLSYFDRFGRSLRESEHIEFAAPSGLGKVIYDIRARRALILQGAPEYRQEERLRGVISEVDARKKKLTIELIGGQRLEGGYLKEVHEEASAALSDYVQNGPLVLIECVSVRNKQESLTAIESISRIERLDPLDVSARIEALMQLNDGWLDGEGHAPSVDGLRWFRDAWLDNWAEDMPLPFLYPTPDGNLQAEWSNDLAAVTAEIDIEEHSMAVVVSQHVGGKVLSELLLSLDEDHGWQTLVEIVGDLISGS